MYCLLRLDHPRATGLICFVLNCSIDKSFFLNLYFKMIQARDVLLFFLDIERATFLFTLAFILLISHLGTFFTYNLTKEKISP